MILVGISCFPSSTASAQATAPGVADQTNTTPRLVPLEVPSNDQDPAFSEMWRAVTNFGDVSVSRTELLEQFRAAVTNHPASKYQEKAKYAVQILIRMIAEDEAHTKATPTDLGRLSVEERVRELIFQLRNQNGIPKSVLDDPKGATNTAPHRLLAIGYPAVPQLLAAVDYPSFTRSLRVTHPRRLRSFPRIRSCLIHMRW